jgi:hypothetical protein
MTLFSYEVRQNVTRAGDRPVRVRPPPSKMLMKETVTHSPVDSTYVTICFMKHNSGGGAIREDKEQSGDEEL